MKIAIGAIAKTCIIGDVTIASTEGVNPSATIALCFPELIITDNFDAISVFSFRLIIDIFASNIVFISSVTLFYTFMLGRTYCQLAVLSGKWLRIIGVLFRLTWTQWYCVIMSIRNWHYQVGDWGVLPCGTCFYMVDLPTNA